MVGSSICRTTKKRKNVCDCRQCVSNRNNAKRRGGEFQRKRKNVTRKEHDLKGRDLHSRHGGQARH